MRAIYRVSLSSQYDIWTINPSLVDFVVLATGTEVLVNERYPVNLGEGGNYVSRLLHESGRTAGYFPDFKGPKYRNVLVALRGCPLLRYLTPVVTFKALWFLLQASCTHASPCTVPFTLLEVLHVC